MLIMSGCHIYSEQEPPTSMLKLNLIADKEQGWLLIVKTMIEIVPSDNPLGPAVITLFLDESPLPTRVSIQFKFYDDLCNILNCSFPKQTEYLSNYSDTARARYPKRAPNLKLKCYRYYVEGFISNRSFDIARGFS